MALDPDLILVLRQDFYSFAKKAFKTLHDKELEEALYLEYVASQLALMINKTVKRCVLSMPPRTLKSELGCIMVSAYLLGQHPETRIMILTHNEALAGTLSRKVRRLLKAPWFKEVFPSCRLERSEEMDFETSAGGGLFASSIEGNITGLGADLIIVDDPVDLRDAGKPDKFAHVNQLFDTLIRSRLNNKSEDRILIIAHRLDENDLPGHVRRHGDEWHHIVLPLVARHARYLLPTGEEWVRQKGDVLHPESYTDKEVKLLRRVTQNPDFETLYQQNTKPAEATRIKRSR